MLEFVKVEVSEPSEQRCLPRVLLLLGLLPHDQRRGRLITRPAHRQPPPPAPARRPRQAEDFRADVPLERACDGDVARLCPRVKPGSGRMHDCLRKHLDELSEACRQQEEALDVVQSRDVRLRPRLRKACSEEMVAFCQAVAPGALLRGWVCGSPPAQGVLGGDGCLLPGRGPRCAAAWAGVWVRLRVPGRRAAREAAGGRAAAGTAPRRTAAPHRCFAQPMPPTTSPRRNVLLPVRKAPPRPLTQKQMHPSHRAPPATPLAPPPE